MVGFYLAPTEYEAEQAPGLGVDTTEKLRFTFPDWEMKHALKGQHILHSMVGGIFWRSVLKLFINFCEVLSRATGNLERQNKVLELANIIINYCIVFNVYYNYIAQWIHTVNFPMM